MIEVDSHLLLDLTATVAWAVARSRHYLLCLAGTDNYLLESMLTFDRLCAPSRLQKFMLVLRLMTSLILHYKLYCKYLHK